MASITDVAGITVGQVSNLESGTGCTVVLGPDVGMRASVFVRGRATGTRELDALSPTHLVSAVHAILLSGGSAFGLSAADGVMRWLAERGRGFDVGVGVVPIVPGAVVFDLSYGKPVWPGPEDGYRACEAAGLDVAEGTAGAGTGATVGKVRGLAGAMKGGVGTWSVRLGDLIVGCLAVVNAFGDVREASGAILAGARAETGFVDASGFLADGGTAGGSLAASASNTTLVVVATNGDLARVELQELARMASDSLARRITPVGTQFDGDAVFAVSTAEVSVARPLTVEMLAQEATAVAIERAVRLAVGTDAIPGLAGTV